VTEAEISESLWYYYFDVDKTVNYLRGKKAPTPKKAVPPKDSSTKAVSRFEKAAAAAEERTKGMFSSCCAAFECLTGWFCA
jgi:hypothetical protein